MRIGVRFSPRALAGANAGLDLDASAARYAEALTKAIAADFPAAEITVAGDSSVQSILVDGVPEHKAASVERAVADLAWVVKQCVPWSVAAR